jgi:putative colanic acid biosynthesis acetyltransferase WcaF
MADQKIPTSSATDPAAGRLISSAPANWKIRRLLWSLVQNSLYHYSFHTWSNWRCVLLRLFGAKIGSRCIIRRTSRIYYPWLLEIGDMAVIGDKTEIYNLGRIVIGDRAMVSQEAYLCAGTHDYTQLSMPLETKPITLGSDAWVCARAFIGPGVIVGNGAIVGACAVVTRNIAPWTIVAGNPARVVKDRKKPTGVD